MLTFGGPAPLAMDEFRARAAHAELQVQATLAVKDRSSTDGQDISKDRLAVQTAEKAVEQADAKVKADRVQFKIIA